MTAWPVCPLDQLVADRGVTALVDGVAVAVFRLSDGSLHAIDARDPFCGANVLARGLVGSRGETVYVASPMYKHRFDLATGECLDEPGTFVRVYPASVVDGIVRIEPAVPGQVTGK